MRENKRLKKKQKAAAKAQSADKGTGLKETLEIDLTNEEDSNLAIASSSYESSSYDVDQHMTAKESSEGKEIASEVSEQDIAEISHKEFEHPPPSDLPITEVEAENVV